METTDPHRQRASVGNKDGADFATETAVSPAPSSRTVHLIRLLTGILVLLILVGILPGNILNFLDEKVQTFTTIFLGIFIEAVPFLLAGSWYQVLLPFL
jgi:hypothetical protein